jgi:hypothetical protein
MEEPVGQGERILPPDDFRVVLGFAELHMMDSLILGVWCSALVSAPQQCKLPRRAGTPTPLELSSVFVWPFRRQCGPRRSVRHGCRG